MSSLAEIEAAVEGLPFPQKEELLASLLQIVTRERREQSRRRFLDNAKYPPIEGGPADLSTNTRERAAELIKAKFDARGR